MKTAWILIEKLHQKKGMETGQHTRKMANNTVKVFAETQ